MNGTLKICVFGASEAKPIPNAKVELFERYADDEAGSIIEELHTGSSGETGEIGLSCPPRELSQEPGTVKPYSDYIVKVSAYGFENVEIDGVQIFDGETAIQNVYMTMKRNGREAKREIEIAPHGLWKEYPSKIPEADVKELPEDIGFVVLPQPVIPEFIVVHTGDPNDASAPNYTVPFAQYIKNVASSEIYSTWPRETVKANVLAIISFTLNRVYTEWYRGKGKNFTITSSTKYDHAFVYQRTIFENISNIVDEIFTTYITKPDIRQPLLAQYCDGNKSQCPGWLSQWGSKHLGDRGYTAIDILRNYYGNDIYLTQAEKVAGIPVSFQGEALKSGSEGSRVLVIQRQLNAISNHFPAIPKLADDGIYGTETTKAVRKFQQIFNMPQSGIVDFATWYRISDIYVGVTRTAELK